MLRLFAHPVASCWMLLRVVGQSLKSVILLAPCKRTHHCWLTNPNIVGCYMLRLFAHPVASCWMLLRVVGQSLKSVILLAPCKRTHHCWLTTPNIVGGCCVRLHVALVVYTWSLNSLVFAKIQVIAVEFVYSNKTRWRFNSNAKCIRRVRLLWGQRTLPPVICHYRF